MKGLRLHDFNIYKKVTIIYEAVFIQIEQCSIESNGMLRNRTKLSN